MGLTFISFKNNYITADCFSHNTNQVNSEINAVGGDTASVILILTDGKLSDPNEAIQEVLTTIIHQTSLTIILDRDL